MKVRDEMRMNGGFVDWCRCFASNGGDWYLIDSPNCVQAYDAARDEWYDGAGLDLRVFARTINPDYGESRGYSDFEQAVEVMDRKCCRDCPAFEFCEAMDEGEE